MLSIKRVHADMYRILRNHVKLIKLEKMRNGDLFINILPRKNFRIMPQSRSRASFFYENVSLKVVPFVQC